ncbi:MULTISPECIES: tyrosine-type recombinase/integrase [Phaeobacter]|jgi:integrase/recombinase XerD|uniref:Site-specific recombinase XerD n=3 Tax=Phaeobacter TaxID=302485 RepID=A0AAN1GW51_9RHOB|nr:MULTISPECIES: tyrosine-type recombinase/integrase [Phaeobacter]AUQ56267.1 Site-specific recombinase XerD [Phaeobacter inhibens]AHD08841.1 Site-specific recombinase XerD [Phaeobacter gallaeciensis DSM 26640]AHD11674.1 Site-specific recombinase XerD [Phaeobacter gallaeciensis DSM 26640]ATE92107.1 Site-specific recombinase XerD [Phaeobacter gallaeciensis]ATE94938.1 Site-specific recombinase XerD [Phaeobacter gallaeciensis]
MENCVEPNEVERFASHIEDQGYTRRSIMKFRGTAETLWAAMLKANLGSADLTEDHMDQLTGPIINAASVKDKKHCRHRIDRFRDFLIETAGAPPRSEPPLDMSPRACLKREYEAYLRVQRGLSDDTIYSCLRSCDRFLTAKFGAGLGDLNTIKPDDITGFILWLRKEQNAPRDKTGPSHLRNLFQFLFWSGKTERNLSNAVPKARQPKPTGIPRYLEPEEVNRLIEVVRNHKKTGRRNYAMLMLIARLGLRAPEVTAIELDDIDWRAGEILIRGKRQLHDRMPLPVEVGEAIVDYIRNERRGPERALFVSVKPPFKRFKDAQILRWILRDAYDATGICPPQAYIGTHILRHSLATDMLRKGASLAEIGDVLRHRSAMTTTIYAQYDVDSLRSISRPWPTSGGVQ